MENPSLFGMGPIWRGGHSPNRLPLATRKSGEIMNSTIAFAPVPAILGGVDKALADPYLCGIVSMAIALYLLTFLAVEPRIADFPLIWRTLPDRGFAVARHGELIGNQGTTARRQGLAARYRI
jgi:hypothetical protein